ncbi:thioesterase II family protein [Lysinibacillus sphaericus]|uniref:Thioesterase n=1 Tax=Lysinibacillus sphaericus OT4b.31 TaxID=1285586 RepID=R7ZIG6_LYSSH|nr:thioesterase domain-containing protein [Lysinibacillus sphaericus]EON73885.1 Thioesterase [Lysinibacillus sphaericus OT4b.31]
MDRKVWFPFSRDNLREVNLFCFHHAGGSASNFKGWVSECKQVNVYGVELPGKGTRRIEEPILNITELGVKMAKAIESISKNRKVVLLGHSMGAAMAFEVAHYLENFTDIELQLLVVVSRQAPHCEGKDRYHSTMADHYLIQELHRQGGTPQQLLENQEFINFVIPSIKNDYILHESFSYNGQKLNTPIIAHYGEDDMDLTETDILQWQEMTHNEFSIQKFQGGHFFFYELGNKYLKIIEDSIIHHNVNAL